MPSFWRICWSATATDTRSTSPFWSRRITATSSRSKNRFLLRFPSDLGIQAWWVKSAKRPSIKQNDVQIDFLNTKTHVVGKYEWESIQVTFRDPIGPSASQALMEWVRQHSESVTGRQGYAAGYKRDVELEMLDPNGVVVQKWILKNVMLQDVSFGDLDYSGDELMEITATLVMDYATKDIINRR